MKMKKKYFYKKKKKKKLDKYKLENNKFGK